MLLALRVLGRVTSYVLIWPVSGVELTLLLPHCRKGIREHAVSFAAIALGVLVGGLLVGMPAGLATLLGVLTCVDVLIGCLLMGGYVHVFEDLKHRSNVVRFGLVATIAPLLTGAIGAYSVAAFLHEPARRTGEMSILANSLGIILILPLLLFITSGEYRSLRRLASHVRPGSLSFGFFLIVSLFTFWQNKGPFLFFVFPPMILVLLTLGLEGAVLTSILAATVGWFATAHGHGPIWLMRSATQDDRLIVLQIFIWMCAATALPVGALLDERRRAERVGEENKAIYETLLNTAGDVIILSSLNGAQRYVSPAIEQLTGWNPEEFLAMDRLKTFHPDDVEIAGMVLGSLASGKREHTMHYRMLRKDGSWCWVEAIVRGYGSPSGKEVAGYVGTIRDISGRKLEEETWKEERTKLNLERQRLAGLAVIDPLTQVLNRRGFDEAMRGVSQKRMGTMCLLMMDVDYFKLYNDTYGHQEGDACLKALAEVFSQSVTREGDAVARLGGEEFAVMLPDTEVAGGRLLAEKILKSVRGLELKHQASPLHRVTISIGITFWDHKVRLDEMLLMQEADRALYTSKQSGKDRATLYESSSRTARIG